MASLLIGGELFARYYLGLGDPPLSVADPDIEYLFKPGSYNRFGNTVSFNAYSMRSPDVSPRKADANEFRLLVVGDSVISGGSLTDDAHLATTLVKPRLERQLGRPCFVGNVSAGSWGPPNVAAYLRKFGYFEADAVVFVFNSGDGGDVPTFQPIVGSRNFPDRKPIFALSELVTRYGPQFGSTAAPIAAADPSADYERVRTSLAECVTHLQAAKVAVSFIIWPDRTEYPGDFKPSIEPLLAVARERNIPMHDMRAEVQAAFRNGREPYRPNDNIHPNEAGQGLLADAIERAVASLEPATAASR